MADTTDQTREAALPAPLATAAASKAALARLLAKIEAEAQQPETAALLDAALHHQRAHVLGMTGPPGVGKSTVTDALIRAYRARGLSVGVIAIDPSSRRSGGALLGDRTRMARDPADTGVFVRSMAARDRLGGIAELTFPAVVVMGAIMDRLIVETVGVGQSETEIRATADTVLFCAQPGAGDTLQAMKAGVLEIPDIVAVTKADLGGLARQTAADLKSAFALLEGHAGQQVAVLSLSAQDGAGIADLVDRLERRAGAMTPAALAAARTRQARDWVALSLSAAFGRYGLAAFQADSPAGADGAAPFAKGSAFAERLKSILLQRNIG
ncbi:MAG: methylmalonyl Co-A mutase-associated GTPase MeaB [Pseudomonadota bacterium]